MPDVSFNLHTQTCALPHMQSAGDKLENSNSLQELFFSFVQFNSVQQQHKKYLFIFLT